MLVHVPVTAPTPMQEMRAVAAVARKPRDAAGVFGLKFADIIHYRPKVTIFGLT